MIKIGCAGFPVARKKYLSKFNLVEMAQLKKQMPRMKTIQKWRSEVPPQFEYVVGTSYMVNKPSHKSITSTTHEAKTLTSKIIVFYLPNSVQPHADNIGQLQNYFKSIPRQGVQFVWTAPLSWPLTLVDRVSHSLGLIATQNPLSSRKGTSGPFHYFRIHHPDRPKRIYSCTDYDLREIKEACGRKMSYVIFDNGPTAFFDAVRFSSIVEPCRL